MFLLPLHTGFVADHAADDNGRYAVGGVHVAFADGRYTVCATDTKELVRISGPLPDAAEYPERVEVATAPNGRDTALVPAKEWRAAFREAEKAVGRCRGPNAVRRHVVVIPSEAVTTLFATDGSGSVCRAPQNVEGRFPPINEVMANPGPPAASVRVDPKYLAEIMTTVARFLKDDESQSVTLELRGNKAVRFRAERSDDGAVLDGLLMPLADR